jgi:hypothetical protein
MIHDALPSSLQKKHNAYSMSQKQEDKAQSGEAQTAFKKPFAQPSKTKTMPVDFFSCRGVVHKESVQ